MSEKIWEFFVVGMLAPSTDSEMWGKVIFVNSQRTLQFSVVMVSNPPIKFSEVRFVGYGGDLQDVGFKDPVDEPDNVREEALRNFLDDKLIIFRPLHRTIYRPSKREFNNLSSVSVVHKPAWFSRETRLIPVPVFNKDKHKINDDDFPDFLIKQKYIGKIDGISSDSGDTPPLILWKKEDHSYSVAGEFQSHKHAYGGFSFIYREGELRYTNLPNDFYDDVIEIEFNDTLIFIDRQKHTDLRLLHNSKNQVL